MAGKKKAENEVIAEDKKAVSESAEIVVEDSEEVSGNHELVSENKETALENNTESSANWQVIQPAELNEKEKSNLSFEPESWTIMIYLSGDNNLSGEMTKAILALENMRRSWANSTDLKYDHIKVLAYLDTGVPTIPPIYYDITDGAKKASYDTDTIQTFIKRNKEKSQGSIESSSSEDSIINFVNWCVNERGHKTANYALFLSGHSNAFDGSNLLRDEDSLDGLTLKSLKSTLSRVKEIINADKTVAESKPLDILGFESCIMSLLEISYEFRDSVRYMISSQGETPSEGWGLQVVIQNFLTLKTVDGKKVQYSPEEISRDIVQRYIAEQHKLGLGGRSVDLSVLDLSKTENVANKLKDLFAIIKKQFTSLNPQIESCLEDPETPVQTNPPYFEVFMQQMYKSVQTTHFNAQTFWFEQAVDIQDFIDELIYDLNSMYDLFGQFKDADMAGFRRRDFGLPSTVAELKAIIESLIAASNAVSDAISKCVIENGSCGSEFQFANGISLFFPWSIQSYRQMMKSYLELDFAIGKGSFWVDFLEFYLFMTLKWRKNSDSDKVPDYLKKYVTVQLDNEEDVRGTKQDVVRGTKQDVVRGTKQDVVRGTKQDVVRGTKQDVVRGSGFANSFKTLKNFDPDYWNFIRTKTELPSSYLTEDE